MYTWGSGARDGVNLGTAVRKFPQAGQLERRRRTWTHISIEGSIESAHAVEFSKTVAPLQEGGSFSGANPVTGSGARERTHEYSAGSATLGRAPMLLGAGA
jgi:hypothetical protein